MAVEPWSLGPRSRRLRLYRALLRLQRQQQHLRSWILAAPKPGPKPLSGNHTHNRSSGNLPPASSLPCGRSPPTRSHAATANWRYASNPAPWRGTKPSSGSTKAWSGPSDGSNRNTTNSWWSTSGSSNSWSGSASTYGATSHYSTTNSWRRTSSSSCSWSGSASAHNASTYDRTANSWWGTSNSSSSWSSSASA